MEYIIIKYISAHRKLLRKEINAKRKRYDRLAAISSIRLLELSQDLRWTTPSLVTRKYPLSLVKINRNRTKSASKYIIGKLVRLRNYKANLPSKPLIFTKDNNICYFIPKPQDSKLVLNLFSFIIYPTIGYSLVSPYLVPS